MSYSDLLNANWSSVPGDIIDSIVPYLPARDVIKLCLYNDTFNHRICQNQDSIVWKHLYRRDISHNVPRDHIASRYLDIMDETLPLSPKHRLFYGTQRGYNEIVKAALKNGADIHTWDDLALRSAADYGHTDTVKLLLDHGADIHADNDHALCLAAFNGRTETVKLLLAYGATITPQIRREVEQRGNPEIITLLK